MKVNALTTLTKDYSIKISSRVEEYLSPDYVYIPIQAGFHLCVKNQELVKKEQPLLENNHHKILSPVSGKVVGAKPCMIADGSIVNCIVIENDYKETMSRKKQGKKDFSSFSKDDLITFFKEDDIYDHATSMFLSEKLEQMASVDTLIINGIEPDLYLASKIFLMQNNVSELLVTIDMLREILQCSQTIFAMKSVDGENALKYSNYIGTYPEIQLRFVPDYYPIAHEKILTSYLMLPASNHVLVLDIDLVYKLYLTWKKNRHLTEKYITITGSGITSPKVVLAKIGSSLDGILKEHFHEDVREDVIYVANGLMRGVMVKPEELIVTEDLEGVVITTKEEEKEHDCINCGLCKNICPVGANPKYVYDHKDDKDKCKKDRALCIHCGLCSYICPSKIHLRKYLLGDDHE